MTDPIEAAKRPMAYADDPKMDDAVRLVARALLESEAVMDECMAYAINVARARDEFKARAEKAEAERDALGATNEALHQNLKHHVARCKEAEAQLAALRASLQPHACDPKRPDCLGGLC